MYRRSLVWTAFRRSRRTSPSTFLFLPIQLSKSAAPECRIGSLRADKLTARISPGCELSSVERSSRAKCLAASGSAALVGERFIVGGLSPCQQRVSEIFKRQLFPQKRWSFSPESTRALRHSSVMLDQSRMQIESRGGLPGACGGIPGLAGRLPARRPPADRRPPSPRRVSGGPGGRKRGSRGESPGVRRERPDRPQRRASMGSRRAVVTSGVVAAGLATSGLATSGTAAGGGSGARP